MRDVDWGMERYYESEDAAQALEEEVEARVDEIVDELDLTRLEEFVSNETWYAVLKDLADAAKKEILNNKRK